jgi:hypothetical protein
LADRPVVDLSFVEGLAAGRAFRPMVFLAVAFLVVVLDAALAVRFVGA